LCHTCHAQYLKGEASNLSIAKGVDFGHPDRLGLDPPTELERALLADVRMYGCVVKITAPYAGGPTHRVLRGHFISFWQVCCFRCVRVLHLVALLVERMPLHSRCSLFSCRACQFQDGAERVTEQLSKERIAQYFQVVFVGPDNAIDPLMTRAALAMPALQVDTRSIFNWMAVRRKLAPASSTSTAMPTLPELENSLRGLTEHLVHAAKRDVTNDSAVAADRLIGEDIAGVRVQSASEEQEDFIGNDSPVDVPTMSGGVAEDDGPEDVRLDHRAIVPQSGVDGIANVRAIERDLKGIQRVLRHKDAVIDTAEGDEEDADGGGGGEPAAETEHGDHGPARAGAADRVQVPRSSSTVNEFTQNHELLYGAFWWEFILGKGRTPVGTVDVAGRRHLLLQFTGRFAVNQELNFLLANQTQRHGHASSVARRLRSDPESFAWFADVVSNEAFTKRLEAAIKNPQGKEASLILGLVGKYLTACAEPIPFSKMAQNADITKLYNFNRNFGLASFFLTVSPDDVHNPLAIRFALRTRSCTSFPNVAGNDFVEALRSGAQTFKPVDDPLMERVVKLNEASLKGQLDRNPVAAAEVFNRMLVTVWRVIFGLEPIHLGGKQSKKTRARLLKDPGLFGRMLAGLGVTEEQQRKALHHHFIGWGGCPPEVLQALFPLFMDVIQELLDSVLCAEVPTEVHVADIIRRHLNVRGRRHCYHACPSVDDPSYKPHAHVAACALQLHDTHQATCRWPPLSSPTLARFPRSNYHLVLIYSECFRDWPTGCTRRGDIPRTCQ